MLKDVFQREHVFRSLNRDLPQDAAIPLQVYTQEN